MYSFPGEAALDLGRPHISVPSPQLMITHRIREEDVFISEAQSRGNIDKMLLQFRNQLCGPPCGQRYSGWATERILQLILIFLTFDLAM